MRRLTLPLAAVLTVTMLGDAAAYGKPRWTPPTGQDVAGVAVTEARPADVAPWPAEGRAVRGPRPVAWPQGEGVAELAAVSVDGQRLTPRPGGVQAGGLPVRITSAADGAAAAARTGGLAVARVSVQVFDRAMAVKAGVDGLLLTVARADQAAAAGKISVEVGYGSFADAYGADWSTRLRLVRLPACVLSTPELAACQQGTPLATTRDLKTQTLTADTSVASAEPTVLAVQSGPSGDNGDYTATSLSLAGTWNVGPQTGGFSYSYPLRMPPSLGGPAPSVSLGYSSASIDGRTATSNNQTGWIGDGWEAWPGFIERKYASCVDDNPSRKTGDLCWKTSNATLSLNGRAGELIETGTANVWRLKNDDGTRIERFADPARANGDNDNEYWKVTTTDGTQYFFGYHRLPNWTSGKPTTDSTWTVPVYGNNTGEPCYNSTFANAWCDQAWRWNLDYVIDPHENSMAYFYGRETGWYGRDLQAGQRTAYTRGGWLQRIEYGMRKNSEYAAAAPLRVIFNTAERCVSGCWTGTAWSSAPNPSAWPDTPWDQDCAAAPCTDKLSPTFWSARRLSKVTTQVRSGATTYRDVESWTLRHEFLNAGDNEGSPMWLRGITRAGHVTTAGGSAVTDPEITFSPGAEPLPNRVDGPADGRTSLTRFRIKTVTTEAGGSINVAYSGPDCTITSLPAPESNTRRCMPAYYSPVGTPTLDWFHKYVVTSVNLHDVSYKDGNGNNVATSEDRYTFYDYLDSPAWHYTDDEITPDKWKTWADWRGYGRVRVRQGSPDGLQTAVEYLYLRGMDGDKQPSGVRDVWVPDTWGGSIEDHEALNGFVRQQITFNGPGGAEIDSTLAEPWKHGPTATRTRNGVTVNAWKTNVASTRLRTALFNKDGTSRGTRTAKIATSYNNDGLPVSEDDFGDEAVTGDDTCTRRSYARNDTTWMIDNVSLEETLSGTCAAATTPAVSTTVLKRSRTFYDSYVDESSFGAAPSKGDPVRVEELDIWNGSTPVYVATSSNIYDNNGRLTETIDARGYKTTTGFTTDATTGLVTATTVTNPFGHQTITAREPAWNLMTRLTDPNLTVTDVTYDGLGRLTAAWTPGRSKASGLSASLKFSYLIRSSGGPSAVTTETLLPVGGLYRKSVNLFDGFFRQRQNQLQAVYGGRVITETLHNSRGQVAWVSDPFRDSTDTAPTTTMGSPEGQIPGSTHSVYDGAGRLTAEVFKADGIEKWRTSTGYGGDRTFLTPPAGGTATATLTDIRGRTTALRQYRTFADLGSDDPAKYVNTRYAYDLFGQLKTVTDAAGNVWSYDYDLRGRQFRAIDPDKGTTTSTYDVAGNLQTVDTGTGTLAFTYDALGRKTSMRDDTITGTKRAEWIYDTLPYGKGKLTSATRYDGGNAYTNRTNTFDQYSRPISTSVVLPAAESGLCAGASGSCTYTTTLTYRANGQPSTITMPQAADLPSEKLYFGFTDVGTGDGFYSSLQVYINNVDYNKLDQVTGLTLGSSETQAGLQLALTYNYDEPTRRLTSTKVTPESKPLAASYNYSYDNIGNITKISQTSQGQSADHQCFTYDFLRRLTQAWTPGAGNCATTPSSAALGGPAPYWHTWTLDDLGNRTKEVRHASAGDATYTYTYPTSGSGAVRPHAVTNVTATGAVSFSRNYTYDNGGNTKTRPNSAGTTQTLTYNKEGHLQTLAQGSNTTRYLYDADGNRLIRTDPDGTKTLYMGNTEVKTVGTTKTAKRFYRHGDATIAIRTAAGLHWIIGDHHGTAELTLKATDLAVVAKRRTLPYGEQRGTTTGTWPTGHDKGFLGATNDPTGLTHISARQYDPFTGRFTSVDPIRNPNDPQQMHGYAYGNNAAVTVSDPSGMCWPQVLCDLAKDTWNDTKEWAKESWRDTTEWFKETWNDTKEWAKKTWSDTKERVKRTWNDTKEWVKKAAKDTWTWATKTAWPTIKKSAQRVWQTARTVINIPSTLLGWGWAELHGSSCGWNSSNFLIVCTGASGGYGRGGSTMGSVFMTGSTNPDSRVLRHEEKHADQYAIHGGHLIFPIFYGVAELVSGGGARNPYERWAGLADGCYVQRPGC